MPREVEQLPTQPRDPSAMGDLMESLPTYRSRLLIYILVLLGIVLTIYAAVSPVDIIVTAPMTLVSHNPVKPIQIDSDGVVVQVLVREGKVVQKGDELVVIDAKELSGYQFALRTAQLELDDAMKDVEEVLKRREETRDAQVKAIQERMLSLQKSGKLLTLRDEEEKKAKEDTRKAWDLELKKHDETVKRLQFELRNAREAAEVWKKETDANARLRGKQVVTEIQFLNVQRSFEEAVAAVRKYESMIVEAEAEKGLIDQKNRTALAQHDRTRTDLQEQLGVNAANLRAADAEIAQRNEEYDLARTDAHRKLALARSRREQARQQAKLNLRDAYGDDWLEGIAGGTTNPSNRLTVKASEAGTVAKLMIRSAGETVQRGQPLMTIVPEGTHLYAEIRIPNRDIGGIQTDQSVRLKLDAFPYADAGTVDAKLQQPLADPEAPEGKAAESYYRVQATLDEKYGKPGEQQWMRPLNRPDQPKKFLLGMTGVAEVVTDKKTILELILKPFRELGKAKPAGGVTEPAR